jgi:hypothetical protein
MSESQGRSFETCWKPATLEHSQVEIGGHMYGFHCGTTSHLMWVQLCLGHCGLFD